MVRKAAQIFGAVLILVGILGFIPGLVVNNQLLGLFEVNALHNIFHILTGVIGLAMSGSYSSARLYFKGVTVVYALLVLLGLFDPSEPLLGLVAHNLADLFLHIGILAIAAYLGFGPVRDHAGDNAAV